MEFLVDNIAQDIRAAIEHALVSGLLQGRIMASQDNFLELSPLLVQQLMGLYNAALGLRCPVFESHAIQPICICARFG